MTDPVEAERSQQPAAPASPGTTAAPAEPSSSTFERWVAAIFWLVIAVAGFAYYLYEPNAQLLLDVSTQPERVSGTVSFEGRPVDNGAVRISVYDAGTRRYVASTTLGLDKAGRFSTAAGSSGLGIEANSKPEANARSMRITAEFIGTRPADKSDKPDQKPRPLAGETSLYINASAPLGRQFLWGMAAVASGLLVLQLWVFTGELGKRKARTLFVLMYFFTFWSLALPLVVSLLVAQNKYLVESMENSPLGLVRAKTSALAEPQWLINIGGVRKAKEIVVHQVKEAPRLPAPANAPVNAASEPASAPQPTLISVTPEASGAVDDTVITIEGGVTVPFFMVLLAMFGAGINMTLKVPAIQRAYEDVLTSDGAPPGNSWNPLVATWRVIRPQSAPQQRAGPGANAIVPHRTAGDIRRDLIENYMYLLSAPLLAIAVYYLLQVMATQVTQPVLVLMALATGLASKAVVGGLIDFAEDRLLSARRRAARAKDDEADEAKDSAAAEPAPAPSPDLAPAKEGGDAPVKP